MGAIERLRGVPLFNDLVTGRTGVPTRVALTLGAAAACIGLGLIVPAVIDISGNRVLGEHMAIGLGLGAVVWAGLLLPIWWTTGRRIARTIIAIVITWAAALPIFAGLITLQPRDPWFAMIVFLLAIGATLTIIAVAIHGGSRPVREKLVEVRCPDCGYSMRGRTSGQCPECGATHSLEAIVAAALTETEAVAIDEDAKAELAR